jgi:hypothetical protein
LNREHCRRLINGDNALEADPVSGVAGLAALAPAVVPPKPENSALQT